MPASSSPTPRRATPFLVVLGLLLGVVALVAAVVFALRVAYADQALPGTRVAGVSLGGKTAQEARKELEPVVGNDVPVVLRAAGRTYRISPAVAGYTVDVDETIVRALDAGRDGFLGGAVNTVRGVVDERDVPLVTRIDQAQLDDTVDGLRKEISRAPFAGELDVTADPIDVEVVPSRTGRTVDRDELAHLLERGIRRRGGAAITVPVTSTPVAPRARVQAVAAQAREYLRKPLLLTVADSPIAISAAQLAQVVALESVDGGKDVRLGAGDKRLEALVNQLAPARERPARNARVSATNPGASLSAKGNVTWRPRSAKVSVTEGRAGREVRRADAAKAIEAAIRAGSHSTRLPVKRVGAAVSRADANEVDSLIGTFTTQYEPGQPRVTNIRAIARTVNGTVIRPGQQFSLNGIVGERTEAKGYVPAPFIAEGNKLEDSVGGGVSQFSTTMYNAAYFAGLQIDSHTPHSFYISRYPAGRESTLNFGSIDLTWTNDTKVPIFVRTSTDATSVTVSLYGSNGGRRVEAVTGARQPRPGGGFSMVVTRKITVGGKTREDRFTTTYGVPAAGE